MYILIKILFFHIVSVDLTCPEGSVHIPMCSETFPVCVPGEMICDRIADCNAAVDELPPICENGRLILSLYTFNISPTSPVTFLPYGPGFGDVGSDITELHYYYLGCSKIPIVLFRREVIDCYVSYATA